jgi:hypothetical protein
MTPIHELNTEVWRILPRNESLARETKEIIFNAASQSREKSVKTACRAEKVNLAICKLSQCRD